MLLERILQDLETRTPPSASHSLPRKAFIQAPLRHGICKNFMQGPLREDLTRISTRSSVKDLYRIMQGPLRQEFSRISTRARSFVRIHRKNAAPQDRDNRFVRACAIDMHIDISEKNIFLMREFSGKMPQTKIMQNFKQNSRGRVCAILHSRNALTWTSHKSQFLREFTGKKPEAIWSTQWSHCLRKNRPQHRHSRCVQACEVEMHGGHLAKAKSSFM